MKPAAHKILMSRRGRENPFFVANLTIQKILWDCRYIFRRRDGLFDVSREGREYIRNHSRQDRRAA